MLKLKNYEDHLDEPKYLFYRNQKYRINPLTVRRYCELLNANGNSDMILKMFYEGLNVKSISAEDKLKLLDRLKKIMFYSNKGSERDIENKEKVMYEYDITYIITLVMSEYSMGYLEVLELPIGLFFDFYHYSNILNERKKLGLLECITYLLFPNSSKTFKAIKERINSKEKILARFVRKKKGNHRTFIDKLQKGGI